MNDDREMLPGKLYDIVRHHEDIAFDKARHLIQRSKVKVIESSGNVFRKCLKPLSDDEARQILQQSYAKTSKDELKLTYLSKLNRDGLFESTSRRFYGSTTERLNEAASKIPDTLVELECFYESQVRGLADGYSAALQGFKLFNTASISALQSMPYHTSPRLNRRLEVKHGINVPIFRLGTRNSIEEMHKCLGLLDRVDVLHWGAIRLWLVLQLQFQRALELRLTSQLTRRGAHPAWCPMPTYHKEFVLAPSLLRKWSIPFEIVVQHPGDVIHLRDWVPHQVLDLGVNISETVSVGSAEWNNVTRSRDGSNGGAAFLNCPCATCKHNVADNNFGANGMIHTRIELMVPRSKAMPCTHVARAIEAAKREYANDDDDGAGNNRSYSSSTNYNAVPVFKEYRKSDASSSSRKSEMNKCYACGNRSDDLKSHLSRHIMCRAKLNLSMDDEDRNDAVTAGDEPVTDESDDELTYNETADDDDAADARFRCAYCTRPFEHRIQLIRHVVDLHKKGVLKRNAEKTELIIAKRRKNKNRQEL